ncbi:hypothetical protein DFH09DRAFT_1321946 [Mycena vulgaris]|nr:hypothetical protein DFH09DRAFT_1321946 [Mycena vulgaris]
MSAYMCANSPPDSTMPWLMPAKRIHLACLNCRRRKIKCFSADETKPCARCAAKSLVCEYMAVSEEQAKSLPNSRATRICLGCPSALNAESEAVHAPIPSKMHSIDEGEPTAKGGVGDLTLPMALRMRARDFQASNPVPRIMTDTSPTSASLHRTTQKYILFNLTAEVPEIPEIPETPDSFPYAKLRIAERMLYTETHNTTALNQSYVL